MAAVGEASGRRAASCFFEVGKREIGSSSSRASSCRISGSEGLIMQMNQYGRLRGHSGCVNTVSFNPAGDLLVSGSDDTDIILWDWLAKTKKLSYPSGHQQNVFHARVMPFTDDSTIVTVAADGQVRVGQLKQGGEFTTKQIGEHHDRAHKLALEPGSPHILYSCGEDGLVQHTIASNEREREVNASRGEVTLSSDVMMHILRLHSRQSELYANHEPSAADFATGGDETFFIGLGDGDRNQRSNSDPRECIVT